VDKGGRLNVEVTVTNTGPVAGTEIVMGFIGYPNTSARRPPKELKGYKRVDLAPGESKQVQLNIPVKDMAYWADSGWTVESGEHAVFMGPSADPTALLSAPFTIN
jgi:beta-glucosidase